MLHHMFYHIYFSLDETLKIIPVGMRHLSCWEGVGAGKHWRSQHTTESLAISHWLRSWRSKGIDKRSMKRNDSQSLLWAFAPMLGIATLFDKFPALALQIFFQPFGKRGIRNLVMHIAVTIHRPIPIGRNQDFIKLLFQSRIMALEDSLIVVEDGIDLLLRLRLSRSTWTTTKTCKWLLVSGIKRTHPRVFMLFGFLLVWGVSNHLNSRTLASAEWGSKLSWRRRNVATWWFPHCTCHWWITCRVQHGSNKEYWHKAKLWMARCGTSLAKKVRSPNEKAVSTTIHIHVLYLSI